MFCVYEHIRPDTNKVFYVGKGSSTRAKSKHRRNQHWNNIVSKAGGFSVNILIDNVDEEFAFFAETERIDQLKTLGYRLANKTKGGEGPSGYRHTDEAKKKISDSQRGNKHWTSRYEMTEERREKLRQARAKFVFTDEIRTKISEAGKRRVFTEETKAKMSQSKSGRKHHMANAVMFDGKFFGCAKELADYTGVNYSTVRARIKLYPERFGYVVLGYTKDLKGVEDE